jgi:hypothetical protein
MADALKATGQMAKPLDGVSANTEAAPKSCKKFLIILPLSIV